jgi:hypothetical protein
MAEWMDREVGDLNQVQMAKCCEGRDWMQASDLDANSNTDSW